MLLHGRGRPSRSGTNQKWRGPDESIQSNLVQYGLQERYVDVLASDISTLCWQRRELFDAIVTDRELVQMSFCSINCSKEVLPVLQLHME